MGEIVAVSTKVGANMELGRQMKHHTPFSCIRIAKEYATNEAKARNFVFSPYSIQLILSLLTAGATGLTRTELLTFLEAENVDDLNSENGRLLDLLCETAVGDPILSVVSGLWIDQSLILKTSFKEIAEEIYKAKAETVDFQDKIKAKEAVQKVNKWAEVATNGLIKSILPEDGELGGIVLANALYFKGRWERKFYTRFTKFFKFFLLDGNSVEVLFMSGPSVRQIATFDNFKILRLPYGMDSRDKHISMYILLPNEKDGLRSLIELVVTDSVFMKKYINPEIERVNVGEFMVPKFNIKYGFNPTEVLNSIGLKLPFSSKAELDEIAHGMESPSLNVFHESYIDVNEEGIEAAGVTVMYEIHGCSDDFVDIPKIQADFVADHPFMFVVKDDVSGAILFMGHVVNPLLQ